jgi:hypothetical protein
MREVIPGRGHSASKTRITALIGARPERHCSKINSYILLTIVSRYVVLAQFRPAAGVFHETLNRGRAEAAPDNGAAGGAPGGAAPLARVRAPSHGARAARSQGLPKGVSPAPGASRRSIPFWGNGKRDQAHPGPSITGAMTHGCLKIGSVSAPPHPEERRASGASRRIEAASCFPFVPSQYEAQPSAYGSSSLSQYR